VRFGFSVVSLKIVFVLFFINVLIDVCNLASQLLELADMEFILEFRLAISVLPTGVEGLRLQEYTVLLNVRMG